MVGRAWRRTTLAAALVLGASVVTTTTGPAAAGATGGRWTQLSSGAGLGISNEPDVARFGSNLIVTWMQGHDSNTSSLKTRVVGANALPTGPESTVLTWSSISSDPAVFLLGGTPTIAFGGLRSLDTTDPYNGPMSYVQSADGVSWAHGPGSLTQSRYAYGDYGIGAVDDGTGQPLVALAAASTDHVTVHHGIDASVPAAAPDSYGTPTSEAQAVSLARDSASGAAYALWYTGSSNPDNGIHAQQVWPQLGGLQSAPLSSVQFSGAPTSVHPGQNVAVANRIGGGVWAAYGSGYPSPHKLVLWQVGTGKRLVLTRPGAIQYVGISAAPGGRMWVWWVEGNAVFATRTNPSVTAAGVVRRVTAPGGASPTRTAGDGALGPLDVVVNAQPGSGQAGIYTTRIVEGLRVGVTPARRSAATGGRVKVLVTDAGVPVRNAKVKVGSAKKHTNAKGRVSFVVARQARTGRWVVKATAGGYAPGRAHFRVVR